MELQVVAGFDADGSPVVGQPVGKEGILAFHRTVVAMEIAEQVCRGVAIGIHAQGLDFQVNAHRAVGLFFKPRDLDRIEPPGDGVGQGEALFVVSFEVGVIERERLAQSPAHLLHDVAGDFIMCLLLYPVPLLDIEGERFSFF